MAAFSNNSVYTIAYTDVVKGTISISKEAVITNRLDITLIGKSRLEYGDVFDDNILHLLENFAAPQDPSPPFPDVIRPDLSNVTSPIFRQSTEGQMWFNTTDGHLYCADNIVPPNWNPVKLRGDISANNGIIAHGQTIPLPFGIDLYDECSWIVSPQYVDSQSNYIACYADGNALVTAQYRPVDSAGLVNGLANYIIIGIKNSTIHYDPIVTLTPTLTPAPVQSATPTLTASPMPSPSAGASPTPTPTVSPTATVTSTPTLTVTPTVTRTITASVTPSPTPSPVTYQTFTLNSAFNNASPGLNYVEYGYLHFPDNSIIFGSISPNTFNGYAFVGLESYSQNSTPPTLAFYLSPNAPANAFTKLQFVDKFGIFRTFTTSDTISVGTTPFLRYWLWNIPALLFNANTPYTILITP